MKRPLLAVPLAFSILANVFPQNPPVDHLKIIEAVNARDHATAVNELREMAVGDPKAFAAGDYDYLLGRMSEADGQVAVAMSAYQQAASRGSILRPYALAHMSRIARSTGNLMLERLYLMELAAVHGESLLSGPATERLARNNFETGNYGETLRILNSRGPAGKTVGTEGSKVATIESAHRDGLVLLGEANLRLGNQEIARQIFNDLLDSVKDPAQPDDVAARSCLSLDLIDGGESTLETRAPDVSVTEHLRRGRVYQFNRNYAHAKLHYEAIVAAEPAGPEAAESLFQVGRGYVQQSDLTGALSYFERVLEQYPGQPAAKDSLLQSASCYARLAKPDEAIKRYQRFIDLYPSDEKVDRAYLNIVDVLRDRDSDEEALSWCAKTENAFAGKLTANLAIFDEARIYIAREDWQTALAKLSTLSNTTNLGGATVPGGTTASEITFLKGYCQERSGNYAAAIDEYLSLSDGRESYYGWRATERLKQLLHQEGAQVAVSQKVQALVDGLNSKDPDSRRKTAQAVLRLTDNDATRKMALTTLSTVFKDLPAYKTPTGTGQLLPNKTEVDPAQNSHKTAADRLIELGLYDEGAPEMEAAFRATTSTGSAASSLGAIYKRGDRGDRALAFIEPAWRTMPADYPIELMPRDQLEMLYPAPYPDVIRRSASERGLDPRFLLAVMRQESAFRSDAKSNAAARGLMQFISTTSDKIAAELRRDGFEQDDLYYPPTAIVFGSQYVSDLFKLFPDKPEAVAGAYNAGEDNMARWLGRSRSAVPEQYVPEIAYSQSKGYVYRVMANYRMYKLIDDIDLNPLGGPLNP